MVCNTNDLTITEPVVPSNTVIPSFGAPFIPSLAFPIKPPSTPFPEDLLDIFNKLSFIVPSGVINPSLQVNFAKDILDGIFSLMDKFTPILMVYKLFLPLLNIILCIIEVICAIANPFKLIGAVIKLFTQCIPAFLALFPVFALIIMIISILLLIIQLVVYIIDQVVKLIAILINNIQALVKAIDKGDAESISAITVKIGQILCSFQNFFSLLSIFSAIISIVKSVLATLFGIPPCGDSDSLDLEGCCSPDVCPSFVKNQDGLNRSTATFQYLPQIGAGAGLLPPPLDVLFTINKRNESWQLYDDQAALLQQFINISDPYDLPDALYPFPNQKPTFFPNDSTYSATTPINQAPYTIDLRLFYNPVLWGRIGTPRYIQFKNCIVLTSPTRVLKDYNNDDIAINSGVLNIAGGYGFEDDGTTKLTGFSKSNIPITDQATLNNFLFKPTFNAANPILANDGYTFTDLTYTFHINYEVLLGKTLITLGCVPVVALNKNVVNTVFGGDAQVKYTLMNQLVNSDNFPNIDNALSCLNIALDTLRGDISVSGAANFQATVNSCLGKLNDDAVNNLEALVLLGFDQYVSTFNITPSIQFTTNKILIKLEIKDTNNNNLIKDLPQSVGDSLAKRAVAVITFGETVPFKYSVDGYFLSEISSDEAGSGQITINYDNKAISILTLPGTVNNPPTINILKYDYTFVGTSSNINTDTSSTVVRDETDTANS